jgi:hypothetical protein
MTFGTNVAPKHLQASLFASLVSAPLPTFFSRLLQMPATARLSVPRRRTSHFLIKGGFYEERKGVSRIVVLAEAVLFALVVPCTAAKKVFNWKYQQMRLASEPGMAYYTEMFEKTCRP